MHHVPNIAEHFRSYTVKREDDVFDSLRSSVNFEALGKGREGTILHQVAEGNAIPLVRSTARFKARAQTFGPTHQNLARQIQQCAHLASPFNNALVERYTSSYAKMASHSDHALDLAEDSFIAIFSCYKNPSLPDRMLQVESKHPGQESFDLVLPHCGVVVFSLETNRAFRHKITLVRSPRAQDNEWLGITFRVSKTHLRFQETQALFLDGTPLTLASETQQQEFFQLRSRENQEPSFRYPSIAYTISEGDLVPPRTH